MERSRVINFGAGPSVLPQNVLEEAAQGLLNYNGTGIGITEISHRSKEFQQLTKDLASRVRTLLDVPPTHEILFTQGGGTGQFSAVVLNLLARYHLLNPNAQPEDICIDYIVTGSWSKKASEEAKRLAPRVKQNIAVDARKFSKDGKSFDNIPPHDSFSFSPPERTAFVYYCENETVDGVQFSADPESPTSFPYSKLGVGIDPPLVADYSSSFLSRPIPNLAAHALIYAGAQKNVGPAGLTIVIARKDVIVDVDAACLLGAVPTPVTMSYRTLADHGSLYNTPPMFPIYVSYLVLDGIYKAGGLQKLGETNRRKQEKLYRAIAALEKDGIANLKVNSGSRSWMNATFTFIDPELEKRFLDGADEQGLKSLKGHRYESPLFIEAFMLIFRSFRSVGGARLH
jgi:phosphoserine aminotransferase